MPLSLPSASGLRTRIISTSCSMLLLATTAQAAPWFLAPFVEFDTELNPWSVATADFDGDGRMDIATANSGWNSVSILLGRGDGTFPDRTEYGVGLVPMGLDVVDINRDGHNDIVVANRDAATVSVLLGNGDGTFRSKVDSPLGVLRPVGVATADVNADGWLDLAVIYSGGGIVSVLGGRGDGTFVGRTDYGAAYGTEGVELADLNGDASPDLVVAIFGTRLPGLPLTSMLSVRLGRGDGSFGASTDLHTAGHPLGVGIADMNRDNHLDLVAGTVLPNEIVTFHGAGDGTFAAPITAPTGLGTGKLAVADLDADGWIDVAAVNWGASMVTVLRGTGNGLLGGPEQHRTGRLASSVAIADLNGDGRADLLTSDVIAHGVSVVLAKEDGTLPKSMESETGKEPGRVVSADFNKDGRQDLAVANVVDTDQPVGTVTVTLATGDGRFGPRTELAAGVIPISLQVADVNGDSFADLAIAGASARPDDERPCAFPGKVRLFLGRGDGSFELGGDLAVACDPTAMAVADLNADEKQDIAVSSFGAAAVSILLGHGDGSFGVRNDVPGGGGTELLVGDVNDDGHLDLVGPGVMLGNGDGTFAAPLPLGPGPFPHFLALGDLDSDGRLDLAAAREHEAWALLGNGDGSFRSLSHFSMKRWVTKLAVADLDADGRLDMVAAHENSNVMTVQRGKGDGTFESALYFGVGGGPTSLAVTDIDGDRRLDLAVACMYSETVSILLNRGPIPPPAAMSFELTPRTLGLASRGRWVKGVLEPSAGAGASEIDVASIRLNGTVPVDASAKVDVGDHNHNGIPDLEVRFDRVALELTLADGEDTSVEVTGTVAGEPFLGTTVVRVRRATVTSPVAGSRLQAGERATVRWQVPPGTAKRTVELRYTLDAGRSWQGTGATLPNSGSCDWIVPGTHAQQARLALVLLDTSDRGEESVDQVLGVSGSFSVAATLPVVEPPAVAMMSLRGATPNPASAGRFVVRFTLRDGSAARLDLIDIAGRVVRTRDVGAMGPGSHALDLGAGEALRPGVYFIRLRQAGQELRTRAAVRE